MKNKYLKKYYPISLSIAAILLNPVAASVCAAEDEEETYSINLVQTAEVAKETVELDNKKVLTETYTAKEGDHIWQILRNRDLLKQRKLGGILSALKKLNPSLSNIDMIHPGEKIIIPLVITPISNMETADNFENLETISLEDMKNLEYYTVSEGDTLVKVINEKYSIPDDILYNQYMDQLRKLNPDLKDPDHILPGQKVRLPIYSPKIVRRTVEEKPQKTNKDTNTLRPEAKEIGDHLNRIFTLIGEEWVQQGKHFIPLKTGTQIDLNNETRPVINLISGGKVIVDLLDNLPDTVSNLIKSNWDNYQIVHITEKDYLESAVDKVLSACNYAKIYTRDESLKFEDSFEIEITLDWIIKRLPGSPNIKDNIVCLNLNGDKSETVPSPLKDFLAGQGIKIVDYPQGSGNNPNFPAASGITNMDDNRNRIIEKILKLSGQNFSSREDIPVYEGKGSDFNLTVKPDYSFKRNGRECIIDLNGLGSDIVALLKEHKFLVLTLSNEPDIYKLIAKTLNFLGIKSDYKKHTFHTFPENSKENVKIIIPGILFKDFRGESYFFSAIDIPSDISRFLSMKVDHIFFIKPSIEAD